MCVGCAGKPPYILTRIRMWDKDLREICRQSTTWQEYGTCLSGTLGTGVVLTGSARGNVFTDALKRLKHGTEYLNYGRDIISRWALDHISTLSSVPKILDIGLGEGTDLLNIKGRSGRPLDLYGLEVPERSAEEAGVDGIEVALVDIERETYPFEDATFDIVLAN